MDNRTFYARAGHGSITFKDLFSETFKKHGAGDGAKLFMAGTPLSTPSEAEMLDGYIKPFVYARVFAVGLLFTLLMYTLVSMGLSVAAPAFLFLGCFVMPLSILMFFWEVNIPRNVALYTVLFIFLIGGALSLLFTGLLHNVVGAGGAVLAALTEEPGKLLALAIFLRKPDKKYILNGMLIGAAVGTGFEAIENAGYAFGASDPTGSLVMRGFQALGGHILWASLYGGALAMVKGGEALKFDHFKDLRFLKYFGAAMLLHMLWNSGVSLVYLPLVGDLWQLILIAAALYLAFGLLKRGLAQVVTVANAASGAGAPIYASAASEPINASPAPQAAPKPTPEPAPKTAPSPPGKRRALCAHRRLGRPPASRAARLGGRACRHGAAALAGQPHLDRPRSGPLQPPFDQRARERHALRGVDGAGSRLRVRPRLHQRHLPRRGKALPQRAAPALTRLALLACGYGGYLHDRNISKAKKGHRPLFYLSRDAASSL